MNIESVRARIRAEAEAEGTWAIVPALAMAGRSERRICVPSLDSNVILRWLIGDVPEQATGADELMTSGARFAVDDVALVEVVFVLERVMRLSRSIIGESIGLLVSTACLDLHRSRWITVMGQYVDHPKQSVVDIYLAVRAAEDGVTPLYTFDAKLAAQHPEAALVPARSAGS